jgi:hypothetical protein
VYGQEELSVHDTVKKTGYMYHCKYKFGQHGQEQCIKDNKVPVFMD